VYVCVCAFLLSVTVCFYSCTCSLLPFIVLHVTRIKILDIKLNAGLEEDRLSVRWFR